MGSLTGGGTRRFPLKPVRVRAASSGETLSAPRLSSLEAPGELGASEAERAGRTAEADIPEFLGWQGEQPSKDTACWPKTAPLQVCAKSLVFSPFVRASNVGG